MDPVAGEDVVRLPGGAGEPGLLVRHLPGPGASVIYVHGATFPSALSVFYRFDGHSWGRSWADDLVAHGFDVWGFDFAGYGGSDRPEGFDRPSESGAPIGRADEAAGQLARVVAHVALRTGRARVSLIAHSWGTMVAGLYAGRYPERIDRLVFFGPIARRETAGVGAGPRAWALVSVADQLARFMKDVPAGHAPVLIEPSLASWGPAYLASDPDAASYRPGPAVKIPAGPGADNAAAHAGTLAYDPGAVKAPVLIVRGEWDSMSTDADAAWLCGHLGSADRRDVKIAKATHLMHLEHGREGLFAASSAFLAEGGGT
jgi:pimeloyl-ACP methyl ester carboxylesterase